MVVECNTVDNAAYQFYPVYAQVLHFKVRAANDACIAFTTGPSPSKDKMIEIVIGGCGNQQSCIRRNQVQEPVTKVRSTKFINADELKGFWIRSYNGIITVGKEGEKEYFLHWADPHPFKFTYVGVRTCLGSNGFWQIDNSKSEPWWISENEWSLDAVAAGLLPLNERTRYNPNRLGIYITRSEINGELIPGIFDQTESRHTTYWKGEISYKITGYETLCCGSVDWVKCIGGAVPSNALSCGKTKDGEDIYMGRVPKDGEHVVGRVDTSKAAHVWVLQTGEDGQYEAVAYKDFEIMVC